MSNLDDLITRVEKLYDLSLVYSHRLPKDMVLEFNALRKILDAMQDVAVEEEEEEEEIGEEERDDEKIAPFQWFKSKNRKKG